MSRTEHAPKHATQDKRNAKAAQERRATKLERNELQKDLLDQIEEYRREQERIGNAVAQFSLDPKHYS